MFVPLSRYVFAIDCTKPGSGGVISLTNHVHSLRAIRSAVSG
jgi:hypothetical protein